MQHRTLVSSALIGSLALAPLAGLSGCAGAPGKPREQGAVVGGVGGALAGAALGGRGDRTLGALIGGAVGAGGGYLIGAQKEKLDRKKQDEAVAAEERAEREPAMAVDVEKARTADLNDDGFVTLDEVVAMERANLSDREMVERLDRTGQVFELTEDQERYLEDRGVSREVVAEMRRMNGDAGLARTASSGDNDDSIRDADPAPSPTGASRDEKPQDFERYRNGDRFDRF